MVMRIGGPDGAQWASHIASVHLQIDSRRLVADVQAGAEKRVILSDKAAVVESRHDVAARRGSSLVDITV
jgi:hypothetical protein